MPLKYIKFSTGSNITSTNLNDLQDRIRQGIHYHTHTDDPNRVNTGVINHEGPNPWGDFVYIGDLVGRINEMNRSVRDHVLDETIHRDGSGSSALTADSQNRMGFIFIRPTDWVWKGSYWESEVDIPDGMYQDCEYLVYFQPYFPGSYAEFSTELNPTIQFQSLQGVVPMNNALFDYTIMAHNIRSTGFTARLYAVGRGTRFAIEGRSESVFMKEGWSVDRVVDAQLSRPEKIQVVDDRLYAMSSTSNKIVVFSNADGSIIDLVRPPDLGYTISSFGVVRAASVDFTLPQADRTYEPAGYVVTFSSVSSDGTTRRSYTYDGFNYRMLQESQISSTEVSMQYDDSVCGLGFMSTRSDGSDYPAWIDPRSVVWSRLGDAIAGGVTGSILKSNDTAQHLRTWGFNQDGIPEGGLATWGQNVFFKVKSLPSDEPYFIPRYAAIKMHGYYFQASEDLLSYHGSFGENYVEGSRLNLFDRIPAEGYSDYGTQSGFMIFDDFGSGRRVIDIDPKSDAVLSGGLDQSLSANRYYVSVGATSPAGVSTNYLSGYEPAELEMTGDGQPIAITSVNLSVDLDLDAFPSARTYSGVRLIFVLWKNRGNYSIKSLVYYSSGPGGVTDFFEADPITSPVDLFDFTETMNGDGSTTMFDDMVDKFGSIQITDIDAGIVPIDGKYSIEIFFSDRANNCVHGYIASPDSTSLMNLVDSGRVYFTCDDQNGVRATQWARDLDLSADGTVSGRTAVFGRQATYYGDYQVVPDHMVPDPGDKFGEVFWLDGTFETVSGPSGGLNTLTDTSPTVYTLSGVTFKLWNQRTLAWYDVSNIHYDIDDNLIVVVSDPDGDWAIGDYYQLYTSDGYYEQYHKMSGIKSNFKYWPGDMSRRARYSLVSSALKDVGDSVNGLYADNPISKMGFLAYTRPVTYSGKRTIGDSFTFDPRFVEQVVTKPYLNTKLELPAGTSTNYFSFVPKLVRNSYVMMNESNRMNSYTNTFFLLNDNTVRYIDIELDLSNPVNLTLFNNVSGENEPFKEITLDDQYSMAVSADSLVIEKYSSEFFPGGDKTFGTNINLDHFYLSMVVPTTPWTPAGWNWMVFGKDGKPSGSDEVWFTIASSGLLSEDELTAAGWGTDEKIYRVRLALEQPFIDAIVSACSSHGIDTGMSVPFAPTTLKKRRDGNDYVDLSIVETVGPNNSGDLAPVGALTNVTTLPTDASQPYGYLDTVQVYDWPMSRGGLWLYLMSPPLTIFPRYLSKWIFRNDDQGYPFGGDHLPYFYAPQDEGDLIDGWGCPVYFNQALFSSPGTDGKRASGIFVKDFSYYKILRRIRYLREEDV